LPWSTCPTITMFIRCVPAGALTRGTGRAMEDDILVKPASVVAQGPAAAAQNAAVYTPRAGAVTALLPPVRPLSREIAASTPAAAYCSSAA
jgi:hypothetical protein